jgi:hypothetical protein
MATVSFRFSAMVVLAQSLAAFTSSSDGLTTALS